MLKEKLKEALKNAGLNEDLANVINVTEEGQIAGIVATIKGDSKPPTLTPQQIISSDVVTNFIKENGFTELLKLNKTLQSEHDKVVYKGVQTAIGKVLDGKKPEDHVEDPKKPEAPSDAPEYVKQMMATMTSMSEELKSLKNARTTETKLEKAQAALKNASIPEALKKTWVNRIDLDSETSFEDQAKALAEEYKSIHVGIVGEGSYEFNPETKNPSNNGKLSDKDKNELADIAKDL